MTQLRTIKRNEIIEKMKEFTNEVLLEDENADLQDLINKIAHNTKGNPAKLRNINICDAIIKDLNSNINEFLFIEISEGYVTYIQAIIWCLYKSEVIFDPKKSGVNYDPFNNIFNQSFYRQSRFENKLSKGIVKYEDFLMMLLDVAKNALKHIKNDEY